MNTEGNSQHTRMLKRTQNDRIFSSAYTDSRSGEELARRNKKFVPNLVLPGSSREACIKSKNTKNNSFKRRAPKKTTTSVEMLDLEKWSKSLIEDYKLECQIMLAKFKMDLKNVAAANSNRRSTKDRGGHMPNTSQAQVQKSPHSAEPQREHQIIPLSKRNFIPPTGQKIQDSICASNTESNQRSKSLMKNAIIRPRDQAQVQESPHLEPQQGQHMISSTTRNFITLAGRQTQGSVYASSMEINHRRESLMENPVNQPVNQPVYQAQVQKNPNSEPQRGQHTILPCKRNFIPPTGRQIQGSACASNTEFNQRSKSLMRNAINRPRDQVQEIPHSGRQTQGSVYASSTEINHRRESLMKNPVNRPVYQAQVQKKPHSSGPQQGLHTTSLSTKNFIPRAGQQIQGSVRPSTAESNHGRESLTVNAVNRPGYFSNLLAQVLDPNSSVLEFGNRSPLYRNNNHTSGMVPGFPLSLHQRLGNTSPIPIPTSVGNSSGGVDMLGWNLNKEPRMFSGGSHVVSNSPAINFSSNLNLRENEARLQMYGPNNGNLQ